MYYFNLLMGKGAMDCALSFIYINGRKDKRLVVIYQTIVFPLKSFPVVLSQHALSIAMHTLLFPTTSLVLCAIGSLARLSPYLS